MRNILVGIMLMVATVASAQYTPTSVESASTVTGTKTFSGQIKVSGLDIKVPTATSLTNTAVLTPTAPLHILSGIGGANDTTNTVTIANPTVVGQELTLVVAGASTNLIGLADSGNLKLSEAAVLDAYDVIKLVATEAAVWVEVEKKDN